MDNTNWNPGIQALFPIPVFVDKASGTEFEDIDNELTDLVKKIEFSQILENTVKFLIYFIWKIINSD